MLTELIRHPILSARFIAKPVTQIPSKGWPKLRRHADDEFDRKYGVETTRMVQITPTGSPNFSHGTRYQATGEAVIRWCIENCGLPYSETTFVDIGCGKGRVVMVAAMYGFKRVLGVEYSPELAAVCRKNLEKLTMSAGLPALHGVLAPCEVIEGDAVEFQVPEGNLLAFFNNPFDEVVHKQVLRNLAASPGKVRIAHFGPGHEVVKASGFARTLGSGQGATLYEIVKEASIKHASVGARD